MKKINGVVPVFVTPMLKSGDPDVGGIHKLANYLYEEEMAALWVLGSASEDINMTRKNRLTVIKEVANAIDGKIPVLAGSGLTCVEELLDFMDELGKVNISGMHFIYRDQKQSDTRMISEITRLADHSPYPIWLYNNVKRGKEITPAALKILSEHENIHGAKYGAFYHMPFIKATRLDRDDFQVLSAGNFFFSALCYGLDASTSSDACLWPELYNELYTLFKEQKIDQARALQYKLIELSGNIPKTDNGENAAEAKYILSLKGICDEYVNKAYRTFKDAEKKKCNQALKDFGFEWAKSL